jgi:hypothetical protein
MMHGAGRERASCEFWFYYDPSASFPTRAGNGRRLRLRDSASARSTIVRNCLSVGVIPATASMMQASKTCGSADFLAASLAMTICLGESMSPPLCQLRSLPDPFFIGGFDLVASASDLTQGLVKFFGQLQHRDRRHLGAGTGSKHAKAKRIEFCIGLQKIDITSHFVWLLSRVFGREANGAPCLVPVKKPRQRGSATRGEVFGGEARAASRGPSAEETHAYFIVSGGSTKDIHRAATGELCQSHA